MWRTVVAILVLVLGLSGSLRIGWVAYGPTVGPSAIPAQVAFLERSIAAGSDERMQRLFPEGALFMHVLTGLAGAASDPEAARGHLRALDEPWIAEGFGRGMSPEHGIFHAAWSLSLAVEIAAASGAAADLGEVDVRAAEVAQALLATPTGVPASYPGGYWPCDAVTAAGALARADRLLDDPEIGAALALWRERVEELADPELGLLPHRVTESGEVLEGPRGSSGAIIQAHWPDLALATGAPVDERWHEYLQAFMVRVGPLVGVREYPVGRDGDGDVDSGPLIAGVSLSASAVTLAAARAVGDVDVADRLDRQAELLGAPWQWAAQRRYAAGLMPVGDAFLAWARSVEPATEEITASDGPRTWWPVLLAPFALLAALGFRLLRPGPARSRAPVDGASAITPD